jgi:ATP-dependent DNA helicase RecG
LALTAYGDLDLSLIDEMPKNRKKVKTIIVPPTKGNKLMNLSKRSCRGKGVFVIFPKIESKKEEAKGLPQVYEALQYKIILQP